MTLVYELDMNILKMYVPAKNELLSIGKDFQMSEHYREIHRHTETDATESGTTPHLRVVNVKQYSTIDKTQDRLGCQHGTKCVNSK